MAINLSRRITLTLAACVSTTIATAAGVANPQADWTARSTAAGVFYANNFNFANTAALLASNYSSNAMDARLELETTNKLSGNAVKINILKTDTEGTGAYRHSFDGIGAQTKNTLKKVLYYQYIIYLPNYLLDHRFKTVDGSAHELKTAIIQEPDVSFSTGEIVVTNESFRRFVTAYSVRGSTGEATIFAPARSGTPCPGSPDYAWQNAIDGGPQNLGGQTDATSCALYKRRYGPMNYGFTATTDYGTSLSAQGNPDADAAINGAVWAPDAWNVIEVYVNQNTQTLQIWHAVYGSPPKLVHSYIGTADIGNRADNFRGVQLLPRTEERDADPTRQDTYALYGEVIASDQFINFPGGFAAPVQKRPKQPTSVNAN